MILNINARLLNLLENNSSRQVSGLNFKIQILVENSLILFPKAGSDDNLTLVQ